jgi:16S rRNA (guanine527-N7)-methyltransferase
MTLEPSQEYEDLLAPHIQGIALFRMVRYAVLLERWAAHHNLVRFDDRHELVQRHLVDSMAALPFLGRGESLLDVGSGAGLPGIPLLVAADEMEGVLLEPRQKRWAFLRTVVRELELSATVERARYQDIAPDGRWSLITARAVGDHEYLLNWARGRLAEGGRVALWITEEDERRLSRLDGWRVLSSKLPGLDRGRLVRLQPCFT